MKLSSDFLRIKMFFLNQIKTKNLERRKNKLESKLLEVCILSIRYFSLLTIGVHFSTQIDNIIIEVVMGIIVIGPFVTL